MYEVIHYFKDLQDNNYPYNVGDKFPHDGLKVSEARLKELSSSNNRQKKPLIKLAEETEEPLPFSDNDIEFEERPQTTYTKTDINTMKTAELQQLAASVGIEDAYAKSGGELKKVLIEHFNL